METTLGPRFSIFFAAAFLSVDEDEDESDVAAGFFDGVNRLNGGAAGGDDIVNDDD